MIDRRTLLAALAALAAAPLRAEDLPALLAGPRTHAAMRHALAPGTGDPAGFRLDAPQTQRRLSDAGRAQARAVGAALRARGARFAHVWTSRWDRCRETAALLDIGPVRDEPALDSFFEDRAQGPAQTGALRAALLALPPDAPAMLVTHQVNVTALTGAVPASGEIVLFRLAEDGAAETLARLKLAAPG